MPVQKFSEDKDAPPTIEGGTHQSGGERLWARPNWDIKEEEQGVLQRMSVTISKTRWPGPNRVEGKLEYTSLLFIPARAPFDLWDREQRHGVKHVQRVFIMDDAEHLMPRYLRFVRGVIDSTTYRSTSPAKSCKAARSWTVFVADRSRKC